MQPDDAAPADAGDAADAASGGAPAGGLPDVVPDAVTDIVSGVSRGLDTAAQWAGDRLRDIFGCLPWESACEPAGQAAGQLDAGHVVDVMGAVL